jgi:hypothetical protein
MKSLYDTSTLSEIIARVESLSPDRRARWGTMSVAQMLAHCSLSLAVVTDKKKVPMRLVGRMFGPLIKAVYVNNAPFIKNSPTHPLFVVRDERDFEKERKEYIALVCQFSEGGEAKCTQQPHAFFGPLTPKEWGTSVYKHLDHHLRQFGA